MRTAGRSKGAPWSKTRRILWSWDRFLPHLQHSGVVQDHRTHLSSFLQSTRGHNPVTIETWTFLWMFSDYYIKKQNWALLALTTLSERYLERQIPRSRQASAVARSPSPPLFPGEHSMAWLGIWAPSPSLCHRSYLPPTQSKNGHWHTRHLGLPDLGSTYSSLAPHKTFLQMFCFPSTSWHFTEQVPRAL